MKVIIPMSGSGSRFKIAGYSAPKPLIRVDGKPIIEHVVNMFSPADEFIFICNAEHLSTHVGMEATLRRIAPGSRIVRVKPHKLGPNYAILAAKDLLDNDPVFVSYCDFSLQWDRSAFLEAAKASGADSASICYKGFHPHLLGPNFYAGVRVDGNSMALEVREKFSFTPDKMDTWQQSGLFWFSSGELLKRYCERSLEEGWLLNGEAYISLIFDPMLKDGLTSLVYPAEHFCQWGTPEDLEEYEAWSRLFAAEVGLEKGATDVPSERKNNVRVGRERQSESYDYWKKYFSICGYHPLSRKLK
jgi:NDP-sugar pyrophosphorylase family protein